MTCAADGRARCAACCKRYPRVQHSTGLLAWGPLREHAICRPWQRGLLVRCAVKPNLQERVQEVLDGSSAHRGQLCDSGLPDPDMCLVDDVVGEPPAQLGVLYESLSRGRWLLGLLVLQSMSSTVLDCYEALLKEHIVVTLFLTMLVGAGGNAGNQSAIKVIRGLATGSITSSAESIRSTMLEQALVGLILGSGLSLGGFARVYISDGDLTDALAISLSLLSIVMTSTILGTALPFILTRAGIDPAHAGSSVQVLMDISGVALTCITCTVIFSQLA